jgi:hypothetical protein
MKKIFSIFLILVIAFYFIIGNAIYKSGKKLIDDYNQRTADILK